MVRGKKRKRNVYDVCVREVDKRVLVFSSDMWHHLNVANFLFLCPYGHKNKKVKWFRSLRQGVD